MLDRWTVGVGAGRMAAGGLSLGGVGWVGHGLGQGKKVGRACCVLPRRACLVPTHVCARSICTGRLNGGAAPCMCMGHGQPPVRDSAGPGPGPGCSQSAGACRGEPVPPLLVPQAALPPLPAACRHEPCLRRRSLSSAPRARPLVPPSPPPPPRPPPSPRRPPLCCRQGTPIGTTDKSLVQQARHLWFFSLLWGRDPARRTPELQALINSTHAFIMGPMRDPRDGRSVRACARAHAWTAEVASQQLHFTCIHTQWQRPFASCCDWQRQACVRMHGPWGLCLLQGGEALPAQRLSSQQRLHVRIWPRPFG